MQEELFCSGTVQYYHQPIGIIVANDEFTAWNAADLVKVTYSNPKDKIYLNVKDVVNDDVKFRISHQTTLIPKSKGIIVNDINLNSIINKIYKYG